MNAPVPTENYDALIVGGGPAGLTAAIYLARWCRTVAVFDCDRPGRSDWPQRNHNYLGFPDGISITELTDRGRKQAEHFGARFHNREVEAIAKVNERFEARTADLIVRSRVVILATGVRDHWAAFPGYEEFIGRSMHWCIVCDGYEMRGQRVLVVGNDAHTADLAMQLLTFTDRVTVLTNATTREIPAEAVRHLEERDIRLVVGRVRGVRSRERGVFQSVLVDNGDEIELDHLFSDQGAAPNTDLARQLGVALSSEGYIRVDTDAKTSVPGVYAAGDVTRLFSHQVLTAAHEGGTAASAANHHLFEKDQAAFEATHSPRVQ